MTILEMFKEKKNMLYLQRKEDRGGVANHEDFESKLNKRNMIIIVLNYKRQCMETFTLLGALWKHILYLELMLMILLSAELKKKLNGYIPKSKKSLKLKDLEEAYDGNGRRTRTMKLILSQQYRNIE
jgi:hypothetical protein